MNDSGILPMEYNVLVKPRSVDEKTQGGVILPSVSKDADKYKQTIGTLIAVSPMAFKNADWPEDRQKSKPRPGDTVFYARYSGASSGITGNDGEEYIIIKDIDITAIKRG